ncbi:uncharacterized protein C8R40DRAFT_1178182 [Lentinula edodes]|uniref:uncharacterized protein n=1 Tax=Lentinula edodes TaxID=5353 RepID=UPI001E8CD348|nr:uncharacterized protein C8R40DRAFT_1178182 [Lentinula edodes]KAH7868148.1 hypothetical protein C8R40DRAFT_1178182 [Lentinula edodes]
MFPQSSKRLRKHISQPNSSVITETADVIQPRRSARAGNSVNLTSKTIKTRKTQTNNKSRARTTPLPTKSGYVTPSISRPKYSAPKIKIDSSSDEEQLLPTKHKRAKKTLEPESEPEQDDENENDTSEYEDGLDAEAEVEGECKDDARASNYIQAEAVQFSHGTFDYVQYIISKLNNHTCTANSTSHSRSGRSTESVLPILANKLEESEQIVKKVTRHQAQKLQSEVHRHSQPLAPLILSQLPQVRSRPLPITRTAAPTAINQLPQVHSRSLSITHTSTPTAVNQLNAASAAPAWLECTNIHVIKKVRTFTLAKTGQPPVMLQIIDKSITYGKLQMIFNHEYSPLHTFKIKQMAHACLMEIAERSGHDGENDVCDRLERGDHDSYSIPLVTYASYYLDSNTGNNISSQVSRRIGNEHADLKAHSSTILQAFGLADHVGRLEAGVLARRRTYYYPEMPNGMEAFRTPCLCQLSAGSFFSSTYYGSIVRQNFYLFKSLISEKSEELEVTKGMVALAAAAIHACLHDYLTGMKSSFPALELDGVWGLAIDILEGIESRNHAKYHRLMHKLFVEATGNSMTARDGWCNQQHLDAIDWDAIENSDDDSNGDDHAHVYPSPVGDSDDVALAHSGTEASTAPALTTIST